MNAASRRYGKALLIVSGLMTTLFVGGAAQAKASPDQVSITNLDGYPSNALAVMSRIETPESKYQSDHRTVRLTISNTSSEAVTVTAVSATKDFTAATGQPLPAELEAGASMNATVTLSVTDGQWWHVGDVTVTSESDDGQATAKMHVRGFWQKESQHDQEPWLPELVEAFDLTSVMPKNLTDSAGGYQQLSTDEVLAPYWTAADPSQPVGLRLLATWRGYPWTTHFRWYPQGSPAATTTVFAALGSDGQSVMPRQAFWSQGTTSFDVTGTFGFQIDTDFTDPNLNDQKADRSHGCTAELCGQHIRVFQARDAAGAVIPGAYIFGQDIKGINYDYQDSVFLVTNLSPAS